MDVRKKKKVLRERIWNILSKKGVVTYPLPCFGRIPNFRGSRKAAENLSKLEEWRKAKVIFCNPDFAQKHVRRLALLQGKNVVMATPRLKRGYIFLNAKKLRSLEDKASTIVGAFKYGELIETPPKPDLIVTGCVAVDVNGNRVGKGGGYGDKEISTLKKMYGNVTVATTVHDLQIVLNVPTEPHDQKVDIIATPTKVLKIIRV